MLSFLLLLCVIGAGVAIEQVTAIQQQEQDPFTLQAGTLDPKICTLPRERDVSQFHHCFINNVQQTLNGTLYSWQQHGPDLRAFFSLIDADPFVLKVFVATNYMRRPNMDPIRCNLPFHEFHVGNTSYSMDGVYQSERAVHSDNKLLRQAIDYHFLLQWLMSNASENAYSSDQWILVLEDDVFMCPALIRSILKIITYPNIQRDTNLWYLGFGATAMFFRASFLAEYIELTERFVERYRDEEENLIGLDLFVLHHAGEQQRRDIVLNRYILVYHPTSYHTPSTIEHFFSIDQKCYDDKTWYAPRLPHYDLQTSTSSRRIKSTFRGPP